MGSFVRDVRVACQPARVFEVLSDLDRLPEISHITVAVRNGPGRSIQQGDTFEQVITVLGVEFESQWEVTEVVQDHLLRFAGTSPGNGRAAITQRVTSDGDGSHVAFDVDYDLPFGIVGEIADKVVFERRNEEDAERILASLKAVCEGTPAT